MEIELEMGNFSSFITNSSVTAEVEEENSSQIETRVEFVENADAAKIEDDIVIETNVKQDLTEVVEKVIVVEERLPLPNADISPEEKYKDILKPLKLSIERLPNHLNLSLKPYATPKLKDCTVVVKDLRLLHNLSYNKLPFYPKIRKNIQNVIKQLAADHNKKIEESPLIDTSKIKVEMCEVDVVADDLGESVSVSEVEDNNFKRKLCLSSSEEEEEAAPKRRRCNIIKSEVALPLDKLRHFKSQQRCDQLSVQSDVVLDKVAFIHLPRVQASLISTKMPIKKRIGRKRIKKEDTTLNVTSQTIPNGNGPRIKHVVRLDVAVAGLPVATFENQSIKQEDVETSGRKKRVKKMNSAKPKFRKRFTRCRECEGCLRPDCKECVYCADMTRNGGQGILKQACKFRKCLNPIVPDAIGGESTLKMVAPLMIAEDTNRKTSTLYKKILSKYFGIAINATIGRGRRKRSKSVTTTIPNENVKFSAYLDSLNELEEDDVEKSVITKKIFRKSKLLEIGGGDSANDEDTKPWPKLKFIPKMSPRKPGCIWPYHTQLDLNEENVWSEGKALISEGNNPLRVACYLCGCAGLEELLYCALCCEPFHSFCLNEDEIPSEFNKHNWCCQRCQFCTICYQPNNLIKCYKCLRSYHSMCLGDQYPLQPPPTTQQHKWCCLSCARCERCGSNVNIGVAKDNSSVSCIVCVQCLKLFADEKVCVKCNTKVVKDGASKVMMCSKCNQYVHVECDGDIDNKWRLSVDINLKYECPNCSLINWQDYALQHFSDKLTQILDSFADFIQPKLAEVGKFENDEKTKPYDSRLLKSSFAVINDDLTVEMADDDSQAEVLVPSNELIESDLKHSRSSTPEISFTYNFKKVEEKLQQHIYVKVMDFLEDIVEIVGHNRNLNNTSDSIMYLLKAAQEVLEWFDVKYFEEYLKSICWSPGDVDKHRFARHLLCNSLVNYMFKQSQASIANEQLCIVKNESAVDRVCAICKSTDDDYYKYSGRLLYCGKFDWVHVNCAVWSSDVIEDRPGRLKRIYQAIENGKLTHCNSCGKLGATVRCCESSCVSCFHFACAVSTKCRFEADRKMYCRFHSNATELSQQPISEQHMFNQRRLSVDMAETLEHHSNSPNDVEANKVSILIGSLTVESFGDICSASCYGSDLVPVNYSCSRVYWSTKDPFSKTVYHFKSLLIVPAEEDPPVECNVTTANTTDDAQMVLAAEEYDICSDLHTHIQQIHSLSDICSDHGLEDCDLLTESNLNLKRARNLSVESDLRAKNMENSSQFLKSDEIKQLVMSNSDQYYRGTIYDDLFNPATAEDAPLPFITGNDEILSANCNNIDNEEDSNVKLLSVNKMAEIENKYFRKLSNKFPYKCSSRRLEESERWNDQRMDNGGEVITTRWKEGAVTCCRFEESRERWQATNMEVVVGGAENDIWSTEVETNRDDLKLRLKRKVVIGGESLPLSNHFALSNGESGGVVGQTSSDASIQFNAKDDASNRHFSRGCQTDTSTASTASSQTQTGGGNGATNSDVSKKSPTVADPLKCPKCRRIYKTEASVHRHLETCDFVVSSSSEDEDDDGETVPLVPALTESLETSATPKRIEKPPRKIATCRRRVAQRKLRHIVSAPPTNSSQNLNSFQFQNGFIQPQNIIFQPAQPFNVASFTLINNSELLLQGKMAASCQLPVSIPLQFNFVPQFDLSAHVLQQLCSQNVVAFHQNENNYSNGAERMQCLNQFQNFASSLPTFTTEIPQLISSGTGFHLPVTNLTQFGSSMPHSVGEIAHFGTNLQPISPALSTFAAEFQPRSEVQPFGNCVQSHEIKIQPFGTDISNFHSFADPSPDSQTFLQELNHNRTDELLKPAADLIETLNSVPHSEIESRTVEMLTEACSNSTINSIGEPEINVNINSSSVVDVGIASTILEQKVDDSVVKNDQSGSSVTESTDQTEDEVVDRTVPYLAFEITSDDGFKIQSDSIDDAWKQMVEIVQNGRDSVQSRRLPTNGINGLRMIGLTGSAVKQCIQQLPGARQYKNLLFSDGPFKSLYNRSGCARSEPYKKQTMKMRIIRQHTIPGQTTDNNAEDIPAKIFSRRSSNGGPFRSSNSRESVVVYRSNIHGLGIYSKRCFEAGEHVMEYAGQVIRSVLADKREKFYESKGIGCYMFRIDENEVVDATIHGNLARFMNHSCEPNCYSKLLTIDNKKHIAIFALRRIVTGEELTYDYKFPIEDVKIPCTCGSRKCRGFLN